jgi:hypothetical protein
MQRHARNQRSWAEANLTLRTENMDFPNTMQKEQNSQPLSNTKGKGNMKKLSTTRAAVGMMLLLTLWAPVTGFADFAIRQAAGIDSEPAVAYNSQTHEYLVVWIKASTSGMGPLMGQRVSESGTLSGNPITISALALGGISVTYNAAQNQFLVAYTSGILPDYAIYGQLLDATGTLVGTSVLLIAAADHPKILYNSLAGNYLLLGVTAGDIYSRKIGANGQPLAAAQNVSNNPTNNYSSFAAAYAPVTSTATPTGRYLLAKWAVDLMMLDSDGKPLNTLYNPNLGWYDAQIPFKAGSQTGGEYNVSIAYGDTSGYSMWGKAFLVVWSDRNNSWQSQEWTGIWGGYVDPAKTDYRTTDAVQDNAFPISYIYAHWAYSTYAASWKPVVAFNSVARKFQVAWRETPGPETQNDTKVPHIRANVGFFSAPPNSNVVLSATNGTEEPTNPAIAASTTGPSALVVWDDLRNQSSTDHDIYGSLYAIGAPATNAILVTNTQDSGTGTLRQAILDANLHAGPDSIAFAIPSTDAGYQSSLGVWTIKPTSPLPDILNDGTLINGLSQAAFAGDTNPAGPEIEIDGSLAGSSADGLRILSYWNNVWGITINRFKGNGISLLGAGGNIIIRSHIGVTPDAKAKAPNQSAGIRISQSVLNFIGFFDTTSANTIGGNTGSGIAISGANSRFNVALVNCIGTNLLHTANLGNGGDGISFSDSANDNAVTGYAFPMHVVVMNNGLAGIHVDGASTVRNLLAAGCISGNGGPGIALSSGGNNAKTPPIITVAGTTLIKGTAAPNNMIFLYNDPGDEGQEYFATVYSDASGKFSWSGTAKGPHVTAVAVDTAAGLTVNNTSPFSAPQLLTAIDNDDKSNQPLQFALYQNYPNPFNPTTRITYQVAGVESQGLRTAHVRLAVYDVLGREVVLLVNDSRKPGRYTVQFDAKGLASGVYIYRLSAGTCTAVQEMILVR